jgi:hypothetical protein
MNKQLVKKLGADATFDYGQPLEDQLAEIKTITQGNFWGVFDSSAASYKTAFEALSKVSTAIEKNLSTTDNW